MAVHWPPPSLMPTACSGCYITSCFSPRAKKSCTRWHTTGRRVRLFWTNTQQGWKLICKNQRVLFYFSLFPRINSRCNPLITRCSMFSLFLMFLILFIFNLIVKRKCFLINTCPNWIWFYLFWDQTHNKNKQFRGFRENIRQSKMGFLHALFCEQLWSSGLKKESEKEIEKFSFKVMHRRGGKPSDWTVDANGSASLKRLNEVLQKHTKSDSAVHRKN